MRNFLMIGGLAAVIALPVLAAATDADAASCRSRKTTGTVIGGLGGALLGSAVSDGAGGAIIGGLGGAVVGHEIGRNGCYRGRPAAYRAPARSHRYAPPRQARAAYAPPPVYYDQYGSRVAYGPARADYVPASYGCRTVVHSFYDERGRLVERSTQDCGR